MLIKVTTRYGFRNKEGEFFGLGDVVSAPGNMTLDEGQAHVDAGRAMEFDCEDIAPDVSAMNDDGGSDSDNDDLPY